MAVQGLLSLNPYVGYLWKSNLNVMFPKRLQWLDIDVEGIVPKPLVTDQYGFRNDPNAVTRLEDRPPDIIGLGDSYINDAAYEFFNYFEQNGYYYYNMAMHRQYFLLFH